MVVDSGERIVIVLARIDLLWLVECTCPHACVGCVRLLVEPQAVAHLMTDKLSAGVIISVVTLSIDVNPVLFGVVATLERVAASHAERRLTAGVVEVAFSDSPAQQCFGQEAPDVV